MNGKLLLVACFVLVFLVACGGDHELPETETKTQADLISSTEVVEPTRTPEPTTPIPEPTATPLSTNTPRPSPTPTVLPTETPFPSTDTPTPTSVPTITDTPEPIPAVPATELQDKWRTPMYTAIIAFGAYDGLLETAGKLQNEEIDGFTATGELFGVGIILKAAEDVLLEWEPLPDQVDLKPELKSNIDAAQSVIGRWLDKEITSSDVPDLIAHDKEISENILSSLVEAMNADGLSQVDIDAMMDDFLQRLESFGESTGEN